MIFPVVSAMQLVSPALYNIPFKTILGACMEYDNNRDRLYNKISVEAYACVERPV